MNANQDGGELADQLSDLNDHLESIRWVDVPGLSATTAATFGQRLREARAELREPRLMADGGSNEGRESRDIEAPKRSRLILSDLSLTSAEPEFAAYPAEDAGFPFVWFDIVLEQGEVSVALAPEDAREWGEALARAAAECEGQ